MKPYQHFTSAYQDKHFPRSRLFISANDNQRDMKDAFPVIRSFFQNLVDNFTSADSLLFLQICRQELERAEVNFIRKWGF